MTPMEIRLKAAELIEERGFWQGDFEGPDGELCLMAAIGVAAGWGPVYGGDDFGPAGEALDQIDVELLSEPTEWNDEPGRTKEEVIAALRGEQL